MRILGCFTACLVIYISSVLIVKYKVKVYTPDSHARTDYRLTVKIKGQGKQKTADHVLYETTKDTERFDISSFLCSLRSGSGRTCEVMRMLLKPFLWVAYIYVAFLWKFPGNFPRYFSNFELRIQKYRLHI